MIYIIPAWYKDGCWAENEHVWYRPRTHTEMDDTVKQIQLFHRRSLAEYRILLLSFAPNFRHFLHRQSIFHAPYWSCFDAMQCIETKQQNIISFHDMEWPQDIEFLYSHFAVVAMLHGQKYALIEFGDDGNLLQIDLFKNDVVRERLKFDDRGFVGSRTQFGSDGLSREYFLDQKGVWKLCLFSDGHVSVNPENAFYLIDQGDKRLKYNYSKIEYDSLDSVVTEVLTSYLQSAHQADKQQLDTHKKDVFCLAMHSLHIGVLRKVLSNKNTVLSFWDSRGLPSADADMLALVDNARYIVAGTKDMLALVSETYGTFRAKMMEISPYDVRVDLGTSRQIDEQRILLPIDAISDEVLSDAIMIFARYIKENPRVRIHLFTRDSSYGLRERTLSKVRQTLHKSGFDPRTAVDSGMNDKKISKSDEIAQEGEMAQFDNYVEEADIDEEKNEEIIQSLFVLEQCVDEMAINKCLRTVSLFVDLAAVPDLFLQIECVSMCIPQVVLASTRYVEDGGNGKVISGIANLEECLHYYLDNFGNWNAAMVSSYEMGQGLSTAGLVERWKEVLAESERD